MTPNSPRSVRLLSSFCLLLAVAAQLADRLRRGAREDRLRRAVELAVRGRDNARAVSDYERYLRTAELLSLQRSETERVHREHVAVRSVPRGRCGAPRLHADDRPLVESERVGVGLQHPDPAWGSGGDDVQLRGERRPDVVRQGG